jgi:phage terminase Nu1 subunit (DNA packaging protein)
MDAKSMLDAAEKAAKMTQGRNSDVLHTLALVQADTGQLKAARENAYELINSGFNSNELLPIFGRIAEELNLPELAGDYYRRVETPDAESVTSIHSFAQMRLKRGVGAESHGAQNAETDPEVAVKHPE